MYRLFLVLAALCAIGYLISSDGTLDGLIIVGAVFVVAAIATAPVGDPLDHEEDDDA